MHNNNADYLATAINNMEKKLDRLTKDNADLKEDNRELKATVQQLLDRFDQQFGTPMTEDRLNKIRDTVEGSGNFFGRLKTYFINLIVV